MKKFITGLIAIITITAASAQTVPKDTIKKGNEVCTRTYFPKSNHNDKTIIVTKEDGTRVQYNLAGPNISAYGGYAFNLGDEASFPQASWLAGAKFTWNVGHFRYKKLIAQGKAIPKGPRLRLGVDANVGEVTFNDVTYLTPSAGAEVVLEFARFSAFNAYQEKSFFATLNPYIGIGGGGIFFQAKGLKDATLKAYTPYGKAFFGLSGYLGKAWYIFSEASINAYSIQNELTIIDLETGESGYKIQTINNKYVTVILGFKVIF